MGYHNLGQMPNTLVSRTLPASYNVRKSLLDQSSGAGTATARGRSHKNASPATTCPRRRPNARFPIRREDERPVCRAAAGPTAVEGLGVIGKRQPDGFAV